MLEKLHIRGYKSIQDMELQLRPLNILIGANGAGKSNFISLFRFLTAIVDRQLQLTTAQNGGPDLILHYGRRVTSQISVELLWDSSNEYRCSLVPTLENSLAIGEERALYHANGRDFLLGTGLLESRLLAGPNEGPVTAFVLERMKSYRHYHFHDTSAAAKVKQLGDVHDSLFLQPDGGNLAAFLYMLRGPYRPAYDKIVQAVRLAAPFFDDFVLEPQHQNPNFIALVWREAGTGAIWGPHALSDGTLRFMCLACLLLQPDLFMPETILLDEPELGLHPYALQLLASLLSQASARRQIIAATQSVPLVDHFAPEDMVVVDRVDNQSLFRRLDVEAISEWLKGYTLGQLWQKNVLGGRPHGISYPEKEAPNGPSVPELPRAIEMPDWDAGRQG